MECVVAVPWYSTPDGIQAAVIAALGAAALAVLSVWLFLRVRSSWGGDAAARAPGRGSAAIHAIGTANPVYSANQETFTRMCATSLHYPPSLLSTVSRIADGSGIATRYCIAEPEPDTYMDKLEAPGERARRWERCAPAMAIAAASDALRHWRHGGVADITHVVTHSCTGFAAPGIDFQVIQALGLPSNTRKIGVNFMGCFGGFTGLYVAKSIVEADPRSAVLVVCAETCTVHMTRDQRVELVIGNTIFADGGGAAIVAAADFRGTGARDVCTITTPHKCEHAGPKLLREPTAPTHTTSSCALSHPWVLGAMSSDIVPDSAGSMTWRAGLASGQYDMWLDKSIPRALSGMFATNGFGLLGRVGISSAYNCAWAIHPGGKAIIKAFEEALALLRVKPDGFEASKEVLRDFGNMSSPTILFVLQRVLGSTSRDEVFTAGFGPGLTIEFGRLSRWTGSSLSPNTTAGAALDSNAVAGAPDAPAVGGEVVTSAAASSAAADIMKADIAGNAVPTHTPAAAVEAEPADDASEHSDASNPDAQTGSD